MACLCSFCDCSAHMCGVSQSMHLIIIIIIKIESAVSGQEKWEHYQSKDDNPTQPIHGRKKRK